MVLELSVHGCLVSSPVCSSTGCHSQSVRQKEVCLLYSNQKGEEKRREGRTPGVQILVSMMKFSSDLSSF